MAFIVGDKVLQALYDAGLLDDYKAVRRLVIDLEVGGAAMMYVEKYADESLLDVVFAGGIQIVGTEDEAGKTGATAPRPEEAAA